MMETPQGDKKSYSWSYDEKTGKMNCCTSETSTCNLPKLWGVGELTTFHDAELAQATKEINAILDDVKKSNKDPNRHLSFIQIKDRHFLVWTNVGIVGAYDDNKTVHKMLRLKSS